MSDRLDFSQRAHVEEEIDGPCSYEDLRDCLRDLAVVNRLTRAHRPVMKWLDELIASRSRFNRQDLEQPARPLRIVDVGCGYGDMLRRIEHWAEQSGVPVELVGVDINANGTRSAREATPAASKIMWVNGDVYECAEAADADVVTASGMTHHLTEPELVRLVHWMEKTARAGWFIVDLHRKPVPYAVFDAIMRGPWWHRFIRPDGLRSIRRSFLAEDWVRICAAAGVRAGDVAIREHRPARLCVGRVKAVSRVAPPHSAIRWTRVQANLKSANSLT